jgi:predicted MFS family arabinose efflux permease
VKPTGDDHSHSAAPKIALVLLAGGLVTSLALGARSTMGIFLDPISDDLGLGASTFALSVAIQNLVWGLGQPIAGAVADRFGTVRVLVVGAFLYGSGLLLVANASSGLDLHLGAGVVIGLGQAAASYSVVLAAIGRLVPEDRRSFALGLATAFGSIGQFVIVPSMQVVIDRAGWRTAMVALGAMMVVVVIAAQPLRVRAQAAAGTGTDEDHVPLSRVLRSAFANRSYLLLNLGFFVCGFHVTFVGVHLPKHLEDLGQGTSTAAIALATIGLFNIAGTFTAGVLGQRRSKTRLLSAIYAGRGLAFLALLLLPTSAATSLFFAAVMGFLWLSTVPLTSGIVMAQFGLRNAGFLFGVVFLSHQIGAFIGSYGAGQVRDAAGSYTAWWWVAVALAVFAAVLHLFIDEGPAGQGRPARLESGRRWFAIRRPRLAPTIATASAFSALVLFTVATTDTSAASVEARQAAVACTLHGVGGTGAPPTAPSG